MTEDDKIAAVLSKAPKGYSVILSNTTREKGNSLTLDDLEEAMRIQCRIEHREDNTSNDVELGLSTYNGKLICYNYENRRFPISTAPGPEWCDMYGRWV